MAEENVYIEELKKFVGQEATITFFEGDAVNEITGTVKALSFNYLHIIMMTDKEKILIKNFVKIIRKRKGNKEE